MAWCCSVVSPRASLVSTSQETEYSTHEHCHFCWSKTFWWGDSCASNSISPIAYSCLPICAAGVGLGYFERGGKMAFFLHSPPSLHLLLVMLLHPPPPHIVQNHVDLLNRSVKLILPWVLGNQWIVNCTLLKQHQSSDWSIILWGMNKDKSSICFRGLSCHHPAGTERKYQVVFFWFGLVFLQAELNRVSFLPPVIKLLYVPSQFCL